MQIFVYITLHSYTHSTILSSMAEKNYYACQMQYPKIPGYPAALGQIFKEADFLHIEPYN